MEKKIYAPDELLAFIAIHPGEMLMDELDARGLTADQFADIINYDRKDFRAVIDGKAPLTVEIAKKVELATGTKAYIWTGLQEDYDRQIAMQESKIKRSLKQIQSAAASVLL